ncbi:hypothetical protein GUITHDRAFT_109717 [Guillardia theta CCMP2712]|uniref:Uncharacterized protein n=1 Tax=Guillardia theta (strain CCMP2712) TaxID=905079 RepID=L1J859_GUITC|nr:hypothetical protein GUITHDRAFT_109717 [Guillardia theta CCMP2712]EKX44260.1 hypothetical protein GUITHDRAFT_109717 [Guillardia theta CCMP2712]|eukprot:XP_005831240.1 hypothetical protein GUITHDRAFT_109717 [Guillardia theta CCMP2712]
MEGTQPDQAIDTSGSSNVIDSCTCMCEENSASGGNDWRSFLNRYMQNKHQNKTECMEQHLDENEMVETGGSELVIWCSHGKAGCNRKIIGMGGRKKLGARNGEDECRGFRIECG